MIAAGINTKALSTYMGHASITITLDRYGHLLPGNEHEAATLLDRWLTSQTTLRKHANAAQPPCAVADELVAAHGHRGALPIEVDVTDEEAVRLMVDRTVLAYRGLDILVASAGLTTSAPLSETRTPRPTPRPRPRRSTSHAASPRRAGRTGFASTPSTLMP
jgi:hypothetical protein